MLIDSHCHLNYSTLKKDVDGVVTRAKEAGVARLLSAGTKMREFDDLLALAHAYDDVYCSVGVHPHHCSEEGEYVSVEDLIRRAADPKVVAIGETGLDYFYDYAPREEQRRNFRQHIRAARECGLPLIVHSRDSEEETIQFLTGDKEEDGKMLRGVMHCFSSKRILAEKALEIGFYISFSGILTFKKSEELRAIARDIPLDRLLVETDAPYLAPEPYRGKVCEPSYVTNTARVLAEVKGVSFEELSDQTTRNFIKLFNKVPTP